MEGRPMLALRKTIDTVRVVSTSDPDVKVKAADREIPVWIPVADVKHGKAATIVEVRPLTSSEVLLAQATTVAGDHPLEVSLTIKAATMGTVSIKGPGLNVTAADDVLATLGGYILQVTLLPEDPTEAAE